MYRLFNQLSCLRTSEDGEPNVAIRRVSRHYQHGAILAKNMNDSRIQLTQDTGSAHWNLVFWVARNIPEAVFAASSYAQYGEYADSLMAEHAVAPKVGLRRILDDFGDDTQKHCDALNSALVCAARGYAKCSSIHPKNKEWMLKYYEVQLERERSGEVEILTGAIDVIEVAA